MKQAVLKGKFLIEAVITLVTGLHIGTSSDFTPIGAVESPFVRDHFTKVPIIPAVRLKVSCALCWLKCARRVMF